VLRHAVDLWSLLPIGELLVVAARLGEGAWLAPHATDADELLTALGRPALWVAPWHWCGFLAAVVAEDPPGATAHAARLRDAAAAAAAPGDCLAPVLARATDCWLDVLAGAVDADAVTAVATSLRDVGMGFDAARLAKEAAVRTADRRTLAAMLNLARAVLPASGRATTATPGTAVPGTATNPTATSPTATAGTALDGPAADAPAVPAARTAVSPAGAPGAGTPGPSSRPGTPEPGAAALAGPRRPRPPLLSDREREVAVLLLEGMTYRQIGDRLFITAKTVEHHVGRMRQRLGSETRTGLFADLREALGSASASG
jgi:DNA-binding CsgD family transcriptional regulator